MKCARGLCRKIEGCSPSIRIQKGVPIIALLQPDCKLSLSRLLCGRRILTPVSVAKGYPS